MKMRKITSLTALLSFVFLLITSVILYIVPLGRVAYWGQWRLWGFSKSQWEDFHTNLGVLFVLAVFVHIWLNRRPIANYLKNRSKRLVIFTGEFNIALILLLAFCLGTYFRIPPLSWVLDIQSSIQDSANEKYGDPPYRHAELSSIKILAQRAGLDLAQALDGLRKSGVKFHDENQTILEIAELNKIKCRDVYQAMVPTE